MDDGWAGKLEQSTVNMSFLYCLLRLGGNQRAYGISSSKSSPTSKPKGVERGGKRKDVLCAWSLST